MRTPSQRWDVAIAKEKQTKPTKSNQKNPKKPTQATLFSL